MPGKETTCRKCDWCNRRVGTHEWVNDIGDRFLRRNPHKDGKGNECLRSFAIVEQLPGVEAVPSNGGVGQEVGHG